VLDRIRANPQLAGIPVILVAAGAEDEDLLEGYKFGADYYLTKPFSPRQLLYAMGLVLGREFPEGVTLDPAICVRNPRGARSPARRVPCRHLGRHRGLRQADASSLARGRLAHAWPCRRRDA